MEEIKTVAGLLILCAAMCGGCSGGSGSSAEENADEASQAIQGVDINKTYLCSMGRQPTGVEINYWNGQKDFSVKDVLGYNKTWMAGSSGYTDRVETITRAYLAEYRRNPSSNELTYWSNQEVAHGGYSYSEIVPWLQSYGQSNFYPVTGSTSYQAFNTLTGWFVPTISTYGVPPG